MEIRGAKFFLVLIRGTKKRLRGARISIENLRDAKISVKNLRGAKNFHHCSKNTPTGYPDLKKAPNASVCIKHTYKLYFTSVLGVEHKNVHSHTKIQ